MVFELATYVLVALYILVSASIAWGLVHGGPLSQLIAVGLITVDYTAALVRCSAAVMHWLVLHFR